MFHSDYLGCSSSRREVVAGDRESVDVFVGVGDAGGVLACVQDAVHGQSGGCGGGVDQVDDDLAGTSNIADAEQLLIRAFPVLGGDTAAGGLKNKMLVLEPSRDEGNYGCSAFRVFLARLFHRVRDVGRSGEDHRIQLIESGDTGS